LHLEAAGLERPSAESGARLDIALEKFLPASLHNGNPRELLELRATERNSLIFALVRRQLAKGPEHGFTINRTLSHHVW